MDDVNIGHFTTEYPYDSLGRRIEKRHADGTATRYVYDGSRVAEEWEISRVYSPPQALGVGPFVAGYDLDGAGNGDRVAYNTGTLAYTMDPSSPDPADAAMHPYTTVPGGWGG